jgi:hypothetical protein
MSVKMSISGTQGRIYADRQECQAYLRKECPSLPGYSRGWNVRYTTDLTAPVWFYLRGEEYSAQLDYFVRAVIGRDLNNVNSFASASQTDNVMAMIARDAQSAPEEESAPKQSKKSLASLFRR